MSPPRHLSALVRYGLPVVGLAIVLAVKLAFDDVLGPLVPYVLLYSPVVLASLYGGFRSSLFTAALALAVAVWFFLPPASTFIPSPHVVPSLVAFLVECAALVTLSAVLQRSRDRARSARADAEGAATRLATTLSSIGDAVISTDAAGRVVFLNPVAEALTGRASASAVGRPLQEIFPIHNEETGAPVEDPVTRVLREGKVVGLANHTALCRADGTEVSIEDTASPVRSPQGALIGVVLVFRDVTLQRREQRRLELLLEASAMLASSLDYESTLQSVAKLAVPAFADWCAVDLVDGDDDPPRHVAVWHRDPRTLAIADELRRKYPARRRAESVLSTGEPQLFSEIPTALLERSAVDAHHLELIRKLQLRSAIAVPMNVRGRTIGALTLVYSESGRRYTDADLPFAIELARRAALAVDNARLYSDSQAAVIARDEFLSVASHELKTPLTPLGLQLQSMETMLSAQAADAPLRHKLTAANRQVSRLSRLVENLLDVSRIGAGRLTLERERLDLTQLFHDVIDRFEEAARSAGSVVRFSAPGPLPAYVDRLRVEQLFANVLSNAIKYGAGSPIDVRLSQVDGAAVLVVHDDGIGIPEEAKARLFGRFERAAPSHHYGGLGLGLYIARQLVEAHGGRIEVQDAVTRGATFRIVLPLNAPSVALHS